MTEAAAGETTGRYLVLLEDDAVAAGARELVSLAGIRTWSTADVGVAPVLPVSDMDGVILHELGVAVVTADGDQVRRLTRAATGPGPIVHVEPERVVHAIEPTAPAVADPLAADETTFTWGLQAVGAPKSTASGKGVRVAVLDTGLDLHHPDLVGRTVTASSFVAGQEVQDGHGHGTHCVGTSCGPRTPASGGPGYGVAYEAEIYAGKVLSNQGSGADGGILSGIAWAITNGCAVISMSLGAPTRPGQPYSRTFETAAGRAVRRGALIVAAAGNESSRSSGLTAPVGHPANCPSIIAVGALDVQLAIADFSCGSVDPAGAVDLAGPGVDVYSSWPLPLGHRRISGTSMATPHVAGVAALIAAATGARGYELWARLAQTAKRLRLPCTDVGSGLVQAP